MHKDNSRPEPTRQDQRQRYVCGSKTRLLISKNKRHKDPGKKAVIIPLLCGRTVEPGACPRCKAIRVARIRGQFCLEQHLGTELFYRHVGSDEDQRILKHLKNQGAKYYRFPQADGAVYVTNVNWRLGGEPVPTDPDGRRALLDDLANTPKGMRISHSRGFGGPRANQRRCKNNQPDGADEEKIEWLTYTVGATASKVADMFSESGAHLPWMGIADLDETVIYVDCTEEESQKACMSLKEAYGLWQKNGSEDPILDLS